MNIRSLFPNETDEQILEQVRFKGLMSDFFLELDYNCAHCGYDCMADEQGHHCPSCPHKECIRHKKEQAIERVINELDITGR